MSNFDSWWQLWPVGTKKGKDAARRAYVSRVKVITVEHPDADAHELLANGLREYLMSKSVAEGFVMHPATWLRGGHWQDDPDRAEKYEDTTSKAKRVSRMDETTRQEMARARRIKEERTLTLTGQVTTFKPDPSADESFELRTHSLPVGVIDDAGLSPFCPICGAEMFFGKVTEKWQCTSRRCYERQNCSALC